MSEYQKMWIRLKRDLIWQYEDMSDLVNGLARKAELLEVILKMDKAETLLLLDAEE